LKQKTKKQNDNDKQNISNSANGHACDITATKIAAGTLALLASVSLTALAGNDNRAPEVPPEIFVDSSTNKVQLQALGVRSQNYTWDGFTWTGPVPEATLFDSEGNIVATHFAGPTWKSNSGSQVLAAANGKVTPDLTAIPVGAPRALEHIRPRRFRRHHLCPTHPHGGRHCSRD
jgi:hypothetical protein